MINYYSHDPDSVLDYTSDWTEWLSDRDLDTISAATVTVTSGVATITNVTFDSTSVTFWVSAADPGKVYATVHITTAAGREDERSIILKVADR